MKHPSPVHLLFISLTTPSSPGQPELEDVVVPPALYHLVPRVVRDIVVLVLLEQISCFHCVTICQDTLNQENTVNYYQLEFQGPMSPLF